MGRARAFHALHRATPLVSAVALVALLAACDNGADSSGAVQTPVGTSSRTTGPGTAGSGTPTTEPSTAGTKSPATEPTGSTTRCHTSELRAAIGRPSPGAGQRNFPIVLTNTADRTCTVRGYPGAAFVDASGKQLGPDPKRSPDTPTTVTLAPGRSAWAGLTFASPEISRARTATPEALLVTPPDERDSIEVAWTAGEVPVAGNESSVFLTVVQPGTGG
ncbi:MULTISPECIES: DUF4232 domain-containing protein [unclassified Streptomyces]|uniref:DUF4232 domain-containing protein n=1 Tax=unclassified Streptomyces TaxID=2593676 RepID=UPI002367182C|nr:MULTISPECIES: DUF4232 domain-containing protein [unclassified Streptomyces]MDF3148464.1 DUF4232 domain-containing protein [Streptomyces sp. T21Q-yed]WDF35581.1 DUF4232 domain-containing protein [Streptomyces sp. T12]